MINHIRGIKRYKSTLLGDFQVSDMTTGHIVVPSGLDREDREEQVGSSLKQSERRPPVGTI